ncbi:DUF2653 family protein [Aneurinibacillus aneurinilyticus]|uniref:DUF2653 family protein n=1 Tax=Aneurinibacillus aneurinilyticus ATCC 12856 TaxID=649747 RepID=U1X287_ANEAE|nr:DUF2653 family protein [Aneurinibacillus aneurinilyticus]ERI08648.1 hypothetical protein HMPREF0083_03223 [Aneurinibacillus aneurinilyticus ATCC 12856]MED0708443.1 DUF2653 family protein [Aneurinibacillus aneurinilyticus]MED0723237.1 DUF2653 family protein [Aneurinibacillus aneurinilyticus]MED0732940.1 DUF2653 family protein [Aneurinibacillus aneurinilyticus]MED0739621.1 DUF2653 family protein [Aneurinibacillus aneurinilyticus]
MKLYFSEQDIIDSCCVFAARQHGCHPEDMEVDLQFHPDQGVHANVRSRLEHAWFHEQDLVDSIAFYLVEYHCFISEHLKVDLTFSEPNGIGAEIIVA